MEDAAYIALGLIVSGLIILGMCVRYVWKHKNAYKNRQKGW